MIPACERFGLGMLPFFPLANGLLTGKYQRGEHAAGGQPARRRGRYAARLAAADWDTIEAHRGVRRGARASSMLQVAIGGLAAQPGGDLGDRRRHHARAGARQRGGRHLAAHRRGPGRPRAVL